MVFAICNVLVLSSYAIPILAAPGTLPVLGNILAPRVDYLGGWTIGRNGTGGACPAEAPSACKRDDYSSLNTQCCPSDQTCFATSIIAYCCPSATDCKASVSNFPVCSVNGMIMYTTSGGYFCCFPGEKGINPDTGFDGLCVPTDLPVASSLLATTATQLGVTAPTGTSGSVTTPASSASSTTALPSQTTSRASQRTSLTSASSGSSSGGSSSGGSGAGTTTGSGSTSPTGTSLSSNGGDGNSNSSGGGSKIGVGAIVGLVIGGIALLLLGGILIMLIKRHRTRQQQNPTYMPAPPGPGPSTLPEVAKVGVGYGMQRKPVAHSNSVYSSTSGGYVSPASPNPPTYSNMATPPPQQAYDPPPQPQEPHNPHAGYSEMEGQASLHPSRPELRGQ